MKKYQILAKNKVMESFKTKEERDIVFEYLVNCGNRNHKHVWDKKDEIVQFTVN